jgi:Tfp pilus assembly protein PilF
MTRWLASLLVCAVALVVCAWFALGARQSHDLNVATDIVSAPGSLAPGQARQAAALLDRAGQLNPDTSVDLARSQLALRQGDVARARALARNVTRSEPDNIQAWLTYATASAHDPAGFSLALRHLDQLAPPVHRGR